MKFIKPYKPPIQYRLRRYTNSWFVVYDSDRKYNDTHKHYQCYGMYKFNKFQITKLQIIINKYRESK